jgi:hypothetical protein
MRNKEQTMPDKQVGEYLDQLRELQDQILTELEQMERAALKYETDSARWNTVRRVLLRFGDHLREHTTQLAAARESLGATQTMPQRMLARSMEAYGALLGAMVGLDDCDLDREPEPGEWTPRQALEHMIGTQKGYLETVRRALGEARPVERD